MVGLDLETPLFLEKKKHDESFSGRPIHAHNVHELYYLIKGTTTYFIENEIFVLHAGDMIFIPKRTLHQTEYNQMNDVERIVFSFEDSFVHEEYAPFIREMKTAKHFTFNEHGLRRVNDCIERIENEIAKQKPHNALMQKSYFEQLLVIISRHKMAPACDSIPHSILLVKNIMEYINNNYANDITLDSLSSLFSISRSYLSKTFKSVANLGIKEYIILTRVKAAEEMLKTTDLSITEIATKCGFNDSNYFAAVFKKIVGTTPKKYALAPKNNPL